jgi:hypothetical protein
MVSSDKSMALFPAFVPLPDFKSPVISDSFVIKAKIALFYSLNMI